MLIALCGTRALAAEVVQLWSYVVESRVFFPVLFSNFRNHWRYKWCRSALPTITLLLTITFPDVTRPKPLLLVTNIM